MHTQPEFYSLEFFSDATFWTVGDASTRRVFLMPLPAPGEFLAFGVLSPSNELIFVARGRVIDHLGPFITRMEQAGAWVELYSRPPLPDDVIDEYTKGGPHEQKETDVPPRVPDMVGKVTLSASTTPQLFTPEDDLWSAVNGATRRVVKLAIPDVTDEWLAFGLVQVDTTQYRFLVAFVARLEGSELGTNATLGGLTVSDQDVPDTLRQYMDDNFPPLVARLAPASQHSSVTGSSVLIA